MEFCGAGNSLRRFRPMVLINLLDYLHDYLLVERDDEKSWTALQSTSGLLFGSHYWRRRPDLV